MKLLESKRGEENLVHVWGDSRERKGDRAVIPKKEGRIPFLSGGGGRGSFNEKAVV